MTSEPLTPPILITAPEHLQALIADLEKAGRFALDTESNSMYVYHYRVCLIQISTAGQDYLIDPLKLKALEPLGRLVQRSDIEITMHAAENDVLMLNRDFGWTFGNLFDTLWGARILGWQRPGLASILKEQFGVQLDKRMQRTNWGKRPLSAEQWEYARMDTHYLLPLRDLVEQKLQAAGRWEEAQEVFGQLRSIRWQEKAPATFWRLNGARDLEPRQRAVLKALFEWREQRASQRDMPPYRIMNNETLIALAQKQPASVEQLMRISGVPHRLPPHLARKLVTIIRRAQKHDAPAPPARNHTGPRPDGEALARYEALRRWRLHKANERGVEADVVLTNKVLMTIARANPASMEALEALDVMGKWRLSAYGAEILNVIRRAAHLK